MSSRTIRVGEVKHWGVFGIAIDLETLASEVHDKADAAKDDLAEDLYWVVDNIRELLEELFEAATEET